MSHEYIQASFNSGEWAPHLYSRTDLEKYRSGAALLENWFVDYRGGTSTRSGTKYVIRCFDDTAPVRLIPFQAAISVGFVLEFGDHYIRFHRNGSPVLEAGLNITNATQTNPVQVSVANTYSVGDWVFISGVGGMTQLNGKYYIVGAGSTGATLNLNDLFGNPVNGTAYSAYTAGGTTRRIYTLTTNYAAADLALLKFVQNVDVLIICHTSYPPAILTFFTETNWTLADIVFGTTVSAPTNVTLTTNMSAASGSTNYSYTVTAVDSNGQESAIATRATLANYASLLTTATASIYVRWDPVPGAIGYNVYKNSEVYSLPVPADQPWGFIGFTQNTTLVDSNIAADFSQPPPTPNNPFAPGSAVTGVTITNPGAYTTAPGVTFSAPPAGVTATGTPLLQVTVCAIAAGGAGYAINDTIGLTNGVLLRVTNVAAGVVTAIVVTNAGSAAVLPANPVAQVVSSGAGLGATFNLTWGVYTVVITDGGNGYVSAPSVTFSAGAATGTANLGTASVGNPAVPQFFQQRLALAAPLAFPQTIYFSQPGNYFNYDVTFPTLDDNSITAPIVSSQISNIKAMIPQPGGLIVVTDDTNFLINGGGNLGNAITPANITANNQSHVGCNDMPPIVVNFDILTVQSKGSSVRDSTYNFYANVYTGTDISVLASHLFFGYNLLEWAWAEEPYKIVWAVRSDGAALGLTFIKEQEFTAWTHHFTEDGDALFKSVATIVEAATVGFQNYVYWVVQRDIAGQTVQYIEYFPERGTSNNPQDYWTVDCAISYSGAPATNFTGGEFLAGKTVTGLADGEVITPFVMPSSGNFTISPAASEVKVGLAFQCDFQTLYIDVGPPTIQTRMKQISQVTLRVTDALGLQVGTDASNLVDMNDLVVGNVGGMTNEIVTGLVTGDARQVINPQWQVQGQIYVRQNKPFPASVLGYIPTMTVENVK